MRPFFLGIFVAVTYLIDGQYSGDSVGAAFVSACAGKFPGTTSAIAQYTYSGGYASIACFTSDWQFVGGINSPVVSVVGASDSSGSSSSGISSAEEIAAINNLYPEAVAILSIAWAARYIRTLVDEWVKEQGRAES